MTEAETSVYSFAVRTIDGKDTTLESYRGQVLLVVNVASRCIFTPQYTALEALHQQYSERGLRVLGFPCDQFGHQEPGPDEQIQTFCTKNYGVTFPLFSKLEVNGAKAHPLYKHLKQQQTGSFGISAIKWNFTKFLVDRDGTVIARFAPQAGRSALSKPIEQALGDHSAAHGSQPGAASAISGA
jgi:glutathione peroxidase